MLRIYTFSIAFFLMSSCLNAQKLEEITFGTVNDDVCYGAVRLGSNLYVSTYEASDYLRPSITSGKIYQFSDDLIKLDSIDISSTLGLSSKTTVNRIELDSDSTFRCYSRENISGNYLVSYFDTSLAFLDFYRVTVPDLNIRTIDCGAKLDGFLYVGGSAFSDSTRPFVFLPLLLKINEQTGQVVNFRMLDSLEMAHTASIINFKQNLIIGLGDFADPNAFFKISTDLQLDTAYSLTSIRSIASPRQNYLMAISQNKEDLISLGIEIFPPAISLITFDSTLVPKQRNIFPLVDTDFYEGNDNFAVNDSGDFFVSLTLDPVGRSWQLQPNLNRPILVMKIAEDGTELWRKELVDSNFRMVSQIITSSTGGVYIISIAYDFNSYATTKTDISIIYLNATGEIKYLHDKPANPITTSASLQVFPNPAKDYIIFSGLNKYKTYTYLVVSNSGVVVQKGDLTSNEITLKGVSNGIYTVYILDEKYDAQVCKVFVER